MGDSKLHAILPPSSASRWLVCTPSARLEEQYPDTAGDAAREGTLAHAIAELILRLELKLISYEQYEAQFERLRAEDAGEFYSAGMYEYCEQYTTFVLEQLSEARRHTPDAQLYVEQRLDLSSYVPEGFGTGDAAIIANGTLHCIDLKYGKGVEVSAVNNSQMKIYALGWLDAYGMLYDIHTVRMTIFQPRIDNYSTWEIGIEDLTIWADSHLKIKATFAFMGQGDFVAGTHCQFCRVKLCKARADYQLGMAKYSFAEPVTLSDEEVSDILQRSADFSKWLKSISEHALNEAVHNGKKWPEFKLVEGRSNRSYVSNERIINALTAAGIDENSLFEPRELLGVTKMEQLLGKKKFKSLLFGLIVKPPGSPTLVAERDPRPEYSSVGNASLAFAGEFNAEEIDPLS